MCLSKVIPKSVEPDALASGRPPRTESESACSRRRGLVLELSRVLKFVGRTERNGGTWSGNDEFAKTARSY